MDEKQEICEKMRVLDRQRDRDKQTDGSPLALFNMFLERCRTQLHVVLAMSPIGDAFRDRLRRFPALINCCTINWFQVGGVTPKFSVANRNCYSLWFSLTLHTLRHVSNVSLRF